MPKLQHYYEPDAIDCNTIASALGNDFGVMAILTTDYYNDKVTVICKCIPIRAEGQGVVQVQSMVSTPLKSKRNLYTMQYSAMLDCWHQLDRGTLAVAKTPIVRDWGGRPEQPRRRDS